MAQAQLQNLRLQLNPHFLFNTLNTISSVMYEDVPAADRMIARLSKIVYHGAAAIDESVLRVGAMKIQLGHVRASFGMGRNERQASDVSSVRRFEDRSGDAVKI